MKQNGPYKPAGFFVMRTPLLPASALSRLLERIEPSNTESARLPDAQRFEEYCARIIDAVRTDPVVMEAILLASPSLHDSLCKWTYETNPERTTKIGHAAFRYFARLSTRPTPFGLFAGYSVGFLGDNTTAKLPAMGNYQKKTQLDLGYLDRIVQRLLSSTPIRQAMSFVPNPTLIRVADEYHFVESTPSKQGRSYRLSAITQSDLVAHLLTRSADGATLAQSVLELTDLGADPGEATEFVNELVNAGVLVSTLATAVTGNDPFETLIESVAEITPESDDLKCLKSIQDCLRQIEMDGLGSDRRSYDRLCETASAIEQEASITQVFQIDLQKPLAGLLSHRIAEEVAKGIDLLRAVAPEPPDRLTTFRRQFVNRFGDRDVPLLELFNSEIGLGADFELSAIAVDSSSRDRVLGKLVFKAVRDGAIEISLSDGDIRALSLGHRRAPESIGVHVSIAAPAIESVDSDDYRIILLGIQAPSGSALLGRFARRHPELTKALREYCAAEQDRSGDAILAEVVHVPGGRLGNVIARPVLRDFEIELLAKSGVDRVGKIDLTDLIVRVKSDRVILFSRSLRREIKPRIASAHNYRAQYNLALYRFLGALQEQDGLEFWSWGSFAQLPFLPRIRAGRVILSLAYWRLDASDIEELGREFRLHGIGGVREWRARRLIPRLFALAHGDNLLPIDGESELAVSVLLRQLGGESMAMLREVFLADRQLPISGPEGAFACELILPFVKTATDEVTIERPVRANVGDIIYTPGSVWVCGHLTCGPSHADRILVSVVADFIQQLESTGHAAKWFFIRYRDPFDHLRIRVQAKAKDGALYITQEMSRWSSDLIQRRLAWDFSFRTYRPECERYGGPEGVEIAEDIFHVDSVAVVNILESVDLANNLTRMVSTLRGVDALLGSFALPLIDRVRLVQSWDSLTPNEERQFNGEYRHHRKDIAFALGRARDRRDHVDEALELRDLNVRPHIARLEECWRGGRLVKHTADLIGSFAHMHVNRMLRLPNRDQERRIYYFLAKQYKSQIARSLAADGH